MAGSPFLVGEEAEGAGRLESPTGTGLTF